MIRKLLQKVFYNPRRHAKKLPFVGIGQETVLLDSARFDFRLGSGSFKGKIEIGDRALIGGMFVFESDQGNVSVGSGTFINGGTMLICRESIRIGSQVTIAWDCTLYDHNSHSMDWRERVADTERQLMDIKAGRNFINSKDWSTVKSRGIVIEDRAWLGFGVTVLNGVHIGEGAIVGAQSVVREDVAPWTVVYGNPAVPVRTLQRS